MTWEQITAGNTFRLTHALMLAVIWAELLNEGWTAEEQYDYLVRSILL